MVSATDTLTAPAHSAQGRSEMIAFGVMVAVREDSAVEFGPRTVQLFERIARHVAMAIGAADLYSTKESEAELNAALVDAGIEVAARVFRRREPGCSIELNVADGERVKTGGAMGRVEGDARGLLAGTPVKVALAFGLLAAGSVVFSVWARRGLASAERAG